MFAAIARILKSVESSFVVGSELFPAGTSVTVHLLFKSVFKAEPPAIGAAAASAIAPEHVSLSANLIKNSVGVLFIIGMIYFLQRTMNLQKNSRRNGVGVTSLFYLAMLTHVLN